MTATVRPFIVYSRASFGFLATTFFATVFFAREVKRGRAEPLAAGVAFEPSDLIGARYVIAGDGADPATAVTTRVRGPAEALLLALWKRRDYSDLQIEGNSVAVAALFDSVITS